VPHLDDVLAAVGNHHERWDGRGYPNAREGEEIPLLGRIMALADALSAMTHDRPYRKGLTLEAAVAEIRTGAGSQFDPDLAEKFILCVASGSARAARGAAALRLEPPWRGIRTRRRSSAG
jgi:HD-GYP domain-containing protein (c-di-GMP phosphodiesterase class II)